MVADATINLKRQQILDIAARHGASNVRVIGSYARGEQSAESDLDLLIDLEPGRSLIDHVAIAQDLEDLLGRPVDVIEAHALHALIRDRVVQEAVPL
jgi:uncharacterized protein